MTSLETAPENAPDTLSHPPKTAPPYVGWTECEVLHECAKIHERILFDLGQATRSIDLETYIFERDSLGESYLAALAAAVRRGVHVRLLIDGIGSWSIREHDLRDIQALGIHVRVFRPASRWFRRMGRWIVHLNVHRTLAEFPMMNKRDHRKLCLVDDHAWVGSANISARHAKWRESAVRVCGPEVKTLYLGFHEVWAIAGSGYWKVSRRWRRLKRSFWLRNRKNIDVISPRVKNKIGLSTWWNANRFRERWFSEATKRIWITSPYFIPTTWILRNLVRCARAGIDVRILVPKTSDWKVTDWVARTHYPILLRSGIRIFEYETTMLHAKVTLVDDRALVGSSNYNHRSLLHDLEIDVVVDPPRAVASVEAQWERDVQSSREFTRGDLRRLGFLERWLGRAFAAFRYVL